MHTINNKECKQVTKETINNKWIHTVNKVRRQTSIFSILMKCTLYTLQVSHV